MDVKYVPSACYAGSDGEKFYQYTMLEEASRKRFLYAYKENSSDSTIDFVQRAILCFGWGCVYPRTENRPDASAGYSLQKPSYCTQGSPSQNALAQWKGRTQPPQRPGAIL